MYLYTVVTCLLLFNCYVNCSYQDFPTAVQVAVKSYGVVPDLIPFAPKDFVIVTYSGDLQIILGNNVKLSQVQKEPCVKFHASEHDYYTLFMLDPDAPSRKNNVLSIVRHWHIGNIPGDDVEKGEVQAVYLAPMPPAATGPHRYVFLVYKQEKKLDFTEPILLGTSSDGRFNFDLKHYVKKYDLKLISANFFQTQFTSDVCSLGNQPYQSLAPKDKLQSHVKDLI